MNIGPVENIQFLNGRDKNRVVVIDKNTAKPIFEATVRHNWPSQKQCKYPVGYLEFSNGKKLNLKDNTIDRIPVILYHYQDYKFLWLSHEKIQRIMKRLGSLSDRHLRALEKIVLSQTESERPVRWCFYRTAVERDIVGNLHGLDSRQLGVIELILTSLEDSDSLVLNRVA